MNLKRTIQFAEKLTVTKDFGVQLVTSYTLGRTQNLFVQFAHIHDVVIQEVIQNVSFVTLPMKAS